MECVTIWTDGACAGNPGPGGWAAVLLYEDDPDSVQELSGSVAATTNNRMELMAVSDEGQATDRLEALIGAVRAALIDERAAEAACVAANEEVADAVRRRQAAWSATAVAWRNLREAIDPEGGKEPVT